MLLEASEGVHTLLDFRYRDRYRADDGQPGEQNNRTGAGGVDLVLPVPVGTRVLDDKGALVFDLDTAGARLVVARGGRGGKGNTFFARATRQAPEFAQPGEDCEESWINLELQLLADVGLVGFPNAGKSTLIRKISSATPRVASYPFTTLVPNLGVVGHKERRFVVADLPGLIEGAHGGRGLGDRFLRHLSRTQMLVYLLAFDGEMEPPEAFDVLRHEIHSYDSELENRPLLVILSKSDLALEGTVDWNRIEEWRNELGQKIPSEDIFVASGVSGSGLDDLLDRIIEKVHHEPGAADDDSDNADFAGSSSPVEDYDPRNRDS